MVTGAGRGIGRSLAMTLARKGAAVVAVSRTNREIAETVAVLRGAGCKALAVVADVSHADSVRAVTRKTVESFGRIDILVNNAGVQGPVGPLAENDVADWVAAININLIGTFLCCRAVLPVMIEQRRGKIINLSGGGATSPRPGFSAYASSKAGIVRLTETLAEEVKEYNIQVNAIAPGLVNTGMTRQILHADWEMANPPAMDTRTGASASPENAAALAVFLASERADGLSGKLLSATYDRFELWDSDRISQLNSLPWYTLRRVDPHTLHQLKKVAP